MKKRFSDAQITGFLKEAESGITVKELCRKRRHGYLGNISPSEHEKQTVGFN